MDPQEHSFIIFYKLRRLFFDDSLDLLQICTLIRDDPIRSLEQAAKNRGQPAGGFKSKLVEVRSNQVAKNKIKTIL